MVHPPGRPSPDPVSSSGETGVYVTLDELVSLRHRASGFSFLPRQPVNSVIAGRHASRVRGRGLNFEELRVYLPGDDVRSIDWKVTARTGKPHVRVFTEERDRPAMLVVDQRVSMFFGSRRSMKSVTAAEVAAVGAWRVTAVGDRVGAVVFNDTASEEIRPHRSQRTVLRILHAIVDKNRTLEAGGGVQSNPGMLNEVLRAVVQTVSHDHLVAIISDFDGADEETTRLVTRLAHHNDVLAVPIYDPTATESPDWGRVVVSDGELQVELDTGSGSLRRRLTEFSDTRIAAVLAWREELGFPVLPITTAEDPLEQIRRLLGGAPVGS